MTWEPATSGGVPPEFLRSCLLLVLGEHDVHGYQLSEEVAEFGIEIDPDTVYRGIFDHVGNGETVTAVGGW